MFNYNPISPMDFKVMNIFPRFGFNIQKNWYFFTDSKFRIGVEANEVTAKKTRFRAPQNLKTALLPP